MLLSRRQRAFTRARLTTAFTAAALAAVLAPGVASAAPPANDDFDDAVAITALPYAADTDIAEATPVWDDPYTCNGTPDHTTWYTYTPTEDVILRASAVGVGFPPRLAAFTGSRGELSAVDRACSADLVRATITVHAEAGRAYHFLLGTGEYDNPGQVAFTVETVAGAPNDDFADAQAVTSVPADLTADLSVATGEAGEPGTWPCDGELSVWYTVTLPETTWVTAKSSDYFYYHVAVYTGDALADLAVVDCTENWEPAVFKAVAGQTYFVRVGTSSPQPRAVNLHLALAPPLDPYFSLEPGTVFEERGFAGYVNGSLGEPVISGGWDFGDGTTAPYGEGVSHRYAADGTYDVTLTVTTRDGRTGTRTSPVVIETHDVSIAKFDVPAAGRVGVAKPITVTVANTRYDESVTVTLHKRSHGDYWTEVGTLTLDVPARPKRKVDVPFSYTFTPADGTTGKVVFRATVELPYPVRDARDVDNEVIATATTVRPAIAGMS